MEYEEEKLTEDLVLAKTRATDLESVKKLNFWGSDIEDISIVQRMPNLEVCSLSVNSISTLQDFENCLLLQELYIRKNKIEDIKEICHLTSLPKLRNLWIADNPCASFDNYRATVLRTLPNLQKLDNVVVTEDEVKEALVKGEDLGVSSVYFPLYSNNDVIPTNEEDNEKKSPDANPENVVLGASLNNNEDSQTPSSNVSKKETASSSPVDKPSSSKPATQKKYTDPKLDPMTLTWEETNKIRQELGLKPIPLEKISTPKARPMTAEYARNAHVLQAVLLLLRELDDYSLEIVESIIHKRLRPEQD